MPGKESVHAQLLQLPLILSRYGALGVNLGWAQDDKSHV